METTTTPTIIENIERVENLTININLFLPTKVESEIKNIVTAASKRPHSKTGPRTGSNSKREWLYDAIQCGKIKADPDGTLYRKTKKGAWKKIEPTQQGKAIYNDEGNVIGHKGYFVYTLTHKGKSSSVYVHETVWMYFHGLIPYDITVDHIKNEKENNALTNLRLLTLEENSRKSNK